MSHILLNDVQLEFPKFFKRSIRNEIMDKMLNKENKFSFYSALKNINLNINEGDKIGLLGANGSGKTSLLKIIAGIYYPNSGSVSVDGKVLTLISLTTGLDPELNGLENIYLVSYLRGYKKKHIESKVADIIDFSELGESIFKPVRVYSSGMLTRLSSSIFVHFESDILLLDEFISTGDSAFKDKLFEFMLNKIKKTKIVLFASHDEKMVEKICNIKVFMNDGQITKIEK